MPRCVAMADQSPGMPRDSSASTSATRLALIRSRIPASSDLPLGAEGRIGQDRADDVGAVRGRVGVVDADRDLHVALDRGGVRGGARDHDQRPDPLRVEREGLGERGGDEELRAGPHQLAAGPRRPRPGRRRSPGRRGPRAAAGVAPRPGRRSASTGRGRGPRRSGCGRRRGAGRCRPGWRARAPRAAPPRRSGARSRPCTGRCGSGSPPRGTAAGGWATWARSSRASGPTPVWRSRSAATRRPPVPPGVWVASARPEVTASWSAPRASARTSSR